MRKVEFAFSLLLSMLLTLPATLKASEAFYIEPFNIEPGATKYILVDLENDYAYRGFQTDLMMPEGLEIINTYTGKMDISLTGRASSSFSISSNKLENGAVRIISYSSKNESFSGNKGALLRIRIKASDTFTGGTVRLTNTIFSNSDNKDTKFGDSEVSVTTKEKNILSASDTEISAGNSAGIDISLQNETTFTAFQFDVITPDGLSLDLGKCSLTDRSVSDHQLSSIDLGNGRYRFACVSTSNTELTGNAGSIVSLWMNTLSSAQGLKTVKIEKIIFSSAYARTYKLDDVTFNVNVRYIPATSLDVTPSSASLLIGDTVQLAATVLPENANDRSVTWASSNESVATVDNKGLVHALSAGTCVITASTSSKTIKGICSVTVSKIPLIATVNDASRAYGDENPQFAITYNGFRKGDTESCFTRNATVTTSATPKSDVGKYDITASGIESDKYSVTYEKGTLTITKAPLTISAGNYTKKQGDPMPAFKATYEGFKNNETEDVLTKKPEITTTAEVSSAPGEYPVTVSGAEAQNYEISYKNGTLTVVKADAVVVTAKSYTRVYGDNNPTFEYTSEGAKLDGTPEITCEATKSSPVGTYPIVIKTGSVKNYNVQYVSGTLTITKAPLTISAGNYTKKQGDPMPAFKASYDGFKNNETEDVLTKKPVITTTAEVSSAPGDYPITVSGAEAKNYEISYRNGTLTVVKADAVIVTAKSYTRVYGDDNPIFEYTSDGAKLDGTPEISCEATKTSPVGTYPIVIKTGSVKNYNVQYVNGTLTITKAPLTISAGNYAKKQGDPMPAFKASYGGFKNNETEDVLTKKPVFTVHADSLSAPGDYPIIVSGAEAQNYDISYIDGVLTIEASSGIAGIKAGKVSVRVTGSYVSFTGISKPVVFRLYGLDGKVYENRMITKDQKLSISHVPCGVYVIRVNGYSEKVLIKR